MIRQGLFTLVLLVSSCHERERPLPTAPAPSVPPATPSTSPVTPAAPVAPSIAPVAPEASAEPAPSGGSTSSVTLEKRHLRDSRPAKQRSGGKEVLTCSVDAEYPVVKGLGTAVDARVNELLRPKEAVLEPDCDMATSYEVRYTVVLNEVGLLSVVFDGNWCCGAHPAYSKRFVNVRLRDGAALTLANVFRPGAAKTISEKLVALARKAIVDDPDTSDDWLRELAEDPHDFSLERAGVRFSLFNATPHAMQSAFEDGFLFSCRSLKGQLLSPGPIGALCAR